jgi:hypothetical protein
MRKRLGQDERGAIAVMTVFMAIFAVAVLYGFVGTYSALAFREGMQDAADAAALSSAVIHARSMNFIVLVNIIMAALMALLIAVKLMEGLCILGMILAAALAWPTFGASLALLPPLASAQQSIHEAYEPLKKSVDSALDILHLVENIVKTAAPIAATAIVTEELVTGGMQPADAGFVQSGAAPGGNPVASPLPLETDTFSTLCDKGGEELATVIALPIQKLDPSGWVEGALKAAANAMTGAFETWLCGGGSSKPPSMDRNETRLFPRIEATDACEQPNADASTDDQAKACEERSKYELSADGETGGCAAKADCSLRGEYQQRLADAREQCSPTSPPPHYPQARAPSFYWYQQRDGTVTYTWSAKTGTWQRGDPEYAPPTAVPPHVLDEEGLEQPVPAAASRPPCGPSSVNPSVAEGYHRALRDSNDVNDVLPVCSTEHPPLVPPLPGESTKVDVSFTEVLNILGCKRSVPVHIEFGDGPPPEGGDARSPLRVLDGVPLGDESFRLRALVHGHFDGAYERRLVRLALHGHEEGPKPLAALAGLGDFSVAAAEYYYGRNEPREVWMWNMKWRARLRRFDVPGGGLSALLSGACAALPGDACPAGSDIERIADVAAH